MNFRLEYNQSILDQIGEVFGTRKRVRRDPESPGQLIKEFRNPEAEANQAQLKFIQECLDYQAKHEGEPPRGLPRIYGLITDAQGRITGYREEEIKGPTLWEYIKSKGKTREEQKLSIEEAKKLFLTLVNIHNELGQAHGDFLDAGVISSGHIKVIKKGGEPQFYFLDYGGTNDYRAENEERQRETIESERRMLLKNLFLPSVHPAHHSAYVDGEPRKLLAVYHELEKFVPYQAGKLAKEN